MLANAKLARSAGLRYSATSAQRSCDRLAIIGSPGGRLSFCKSDAKPSESSVSRIPIECSIAVGSRVSPSWVSTSACFSRYFRRWACKGASEGTSGTSSLAMLGRAAARRFGVDAVFLRRTWRDFFGRRAFVKKARKPVFCPGLSADILLEKAAGDEWEVVEELVSSLPICSSYCGTDLED